MSYCCSFAFMNISFILLAQLLASSLIIRLKLKLFSYPKMISLIVYPNYTPLFPFPSVNRKTGKLSNVRCLTNGIVIILWLYTASILQITKQCFFFTGQNLVNGRTTVSYPLSSSASVNRPTWAVLTRNMSSPSQDAMNSSPQESKQLPIKAGLYSNSHCTNI